MKPRARSSFGPLLGLRPAGARRLERARGAVIIVVLVTVLLASLMLARFMESSRVELVLATRDADRERLRGEAYSALETALAVMAEIQAVDGDLHAPDQGWGDPFAYAGDTPREGLQVSFEYTDESGKISLPRLSFDELVELAQSLGLGDNDARRFADGLFAWTRADHLPQEMDAEASRYERSALPHEPPRRSLRSWEELRAVRVARDYAYDEEGALTPFGSALRETLSLYDFEGSNVNALSPAIGALRGWDSSQLGSLASYTTGRAGRAAGAPPWFRGVDDVRGVLGANADTEGLGASVKLLRVVVTVREGAASATVSALVGVDKSVSLPAPAAGPGENPGGSAAEKTEAATPPPTEEGATVARVRGRGRQSAETGEGATTSEEKLDYPFRILEVVETSGPAPTPPPEDSATEDPLS
jgi:hypothetical protein